MRETRRRLLARALPVASALLVFLPAPAFADSDKPPRDLIITVGGGGQFLPRYPGADENKLSFLPVIAFRHAGDPLSFGAADQGFGIDFSGASKIDIGPVVQLQASRRDKDVGVPIGKVGMTIEAGAFVQTYVAPFLRLRVEGRRGIGGHDAWVGDISADFVYRDDDRTIVSLGPRVRVAEAKYQRAYFGITPAAALATGLPVYDPGGGIYELGLASSFTHQFSFTWGIRAFAGYDRLIGDGGKSPLVQAYGDRDQFSAGLAISYTFRTRGIRL